MPDSTSAISFVPGACASPPNDSPGSSSQRHSSAAHGGSVAPRIVPWPPAGPCHSTRAASLIRTAGSPPMSTSWVTGTANASLIRASVARLGFERPCSSATRTPLLTSARAASWSSDQPRSARSPRTVRPIAAASSPASG